MTLLSIYRRIRALRRGPIRPNERMDFNAIAMNNTITISRACAECSFWNPLEEGHGECRRHAPQTVAFEVDDEVKFESVFPVTAGDDWCGDFEKKD